MAALGDTVNRNPWMVGGTVILFLLMMIPGSLFLRNEWLSMQAGVDQRKPVPRLGYCSSDQVTPCIVSFSLDADGQMTVSILIEGPRFPNFYLRIRHGKGENTYICQRVKGSATYVYCTGAPLPLGETFQFFLFSLNGETTLAQGNFPIIGMALGTPDIFSSPTLGTPSPSVTISATGTLPSGTSTPIQATPTPPTPSYPNPTAYPNPKP